ncbi:MAG: MopE-related protein [Chitinophagales bacterium]
MRHSVFTIASFFLSCVVHAQTAPGIEWQNTIGGTKYDDVKSIIQTSDGGYLVSGDSNSNMSGDKSEDKKGDVDYWIVKLDAIGNIVWDNTIGGNKVDNAYGVIETNEGEYIISGTSYSGSSGDKTENAIGEGDIWLVKLDSIGNMLWDKTIGGTALDIPSQIESCNDGGFIVCAWSRSPAGADKEENSFLNIFGVYTADYWIIKFDEDGNIQWQNTIGGGGEDYAYCIEQTFDNGYIVGGGSYSGISGDKTEDQWGISSPDYWVLKLDSVGNIEWQNTIGTEAFEELYDIIETEKGYLLGGLSWGDVGGDKTEPTNGSADYWVLQLDLFGDIVWQLSIGGSAQDQLYSMEKDAEGYFLGGWSTSGISGDKTDDSEGSNDYWIIKIDTIGNILWQTGIGGNSSDALTCISSTADGSIILTGNTLSGLSGDKTENSMGQSDYWVVKLQCSQSTFYADADGDGFGNMLDSVSSCTTPVGYITNNTDCDDANAAIYPTSMEVCNMLDDNCNTVIDEGFVINTFYLDSDGDNFGTSETDSATCLTSIDGFVADNTDCDDTNELIYPGATELPDGIDNNCNELIDEGIVSVPDVEKIITLNIFPNPTSDHFTIEIQSTEIQSADIKISITNMLGEEIFSETARLISGELNKTIQLTETLVSGIYTVKIISGKHTLSEQLIIV